MRRIVTSEMVSHARLKWLLQKRNEEADNLVFYLHNQCNKNLLCGGQVFNLRLLTRQFSGNVIRKMVFNKRYFGKGRKDGGPCSEEIEHVDSAFTVLSYIYALAMGVVNKYHDPIIEERIRQWSDGSMKNRLPEDLLDVLISLKDEHENPLLSTEEIKAQATVDNPPIFVEWAMAEMINQRGYSREKQEEIDKVVGKTFGYKNRLSKT
ncbi:hypothetical protein MKW92_007872 [Papaver armeniacum]|nr:hypothetical protein MKW92_007872 [Papaver armeniacum]